MFLIESAQDAIRKSLNICVLTGAGVSAESGVATFRGENGLWSKFKPEELANINSVEPNPGHFALAEWESLHSSFTLVTQNVDGLHQRAGSRRIIELHGNIWRNRCLRCGNASDAAEVNIKDKVPLCSCGGMLRPDVVWFGEMLPPDAIEKAFAAAEAADLFLSVGTSALVHPAASLPEIARTRGAFLIEVNIEHTALTPFADLFLEGPSGEVLPELLSQWKAEKSA
jgi:NAD-dependent deacetylase